jgi:response regulator RpfG family c-di-GMP phosphodiesterase
MINILILDDDKYAVESNTNAVTQILQTDNFNKLEYNIIKNTSSQKTMKLLESNMIFDIAILDYDMPIYNGIEIYKKLKEINKDVLTILISAKNSQRDKRDFFKAGITDFISKPSDIFDISWKVKSLLQIKIHEQESKELNKELKKKLDSSEIEAIELLGQIGEYRDTDTSEHVRRVGLTSRILGEKYGLNETDLILLEQGAQLHDIGKVGIEDKILKKPGKLTKEEYETMKKHTLIGFDILKEKENIFLSTAAVIALEHHERWDGKGYPNNKKGNEISIFARITSISDVFDALTSKRVYKEDWSVEDSINEIRINSGTQFDPSLVKLLIENQEEIIDVRRIIREETKYFY